MVQDDPKRMSIHPTTSSEELTKLQEATKKEKEEEREQSNCLILHYPSVNSTILVLEKQNKTKRITWREIYPFLT